MARINSKVQRPSIKLRNEAGHTVYLTFSLPLVFPDKQFYTGCVQSDVFEHFKNIIRIVWIYSLHRLILTSQKVERSLKAQMLFNEILCATITLCLSIGM